MRLCSYTITNDTGLAPNPFWGYCTLAVCTPNHMGIRAKSRDWFIGTTTVAKGSKLIYAMQVSEVLSFDLYYNDQRFEKKRPIISGTWQQRCGDNMYNKDRTGKWLQHPTQYHNNENAVKKDLKHPFVFIAEHFYYFGDKAVKIPTKYEELIRKRQGCKCSYPPNTVDRFLNWLQSTFTSGIHGNPADKSKIICSSC